MLGDLLRKQREKIGYTQDDVAKLAGINRASIAKFETGAYLPSIHLANKLFKILDLREFSKMTSRIMSGV